MEGAKMEGAMAKKKIITLEMRAALLQGEQHITMKMIQPLIAEITINRADVKNVMSHRTRAQLFNQLQLNDQDPDIRVTILRGAGGNFSAGHDFDSNREENLPFFEPEFDGQTSRHVLNGWFMMNDLSKPIIAMVEGEATGGGLELAAACDVCVVANDATIGYGSVRGQGLPDYQILPWMCGMRNAMELMLTNRPMTGIEAAEKKFATFAYPAAELEENTLKLAARISQIPSDLLAFNKKSVHRAFEAMGMRTNLRNALDLEALMFKAPGAKMLVARRGAAGSRPGQGVPQRVPAPRPGKSAQAPAAVATQAVNATSPAPAEASRSVPPPPAQTRAVAKEMVVGGEDVASDVAEKPVAKAAPKAPAPKAAPKAPTPKVPLTAAPKTPAQAPVTAAPKAAPKALVTVAPKAPVTVAPKAPVTAAPKTPAKAPVAAAAQKPAKAEKADANGVHVHLHEAVHIHIGGNRTPSKL